MTKHRNVLVVGVGSSRYERIAPVLRRREFDVDRFPGASGAVELLDAVRFAGLIVGMPLPDGDLVALLAAIRKSAFSSRTFVAVLHPPELADEAQKLLALGADQLLGWDATASEYESFVAAALGVPPRHGVRLPVRLRVSLVTGGELLPANTENVSRTGMLVECHGSLLVGDRARFSITLDGGSPPIEGTGEIVRVADPAFDGIEGYGVHFREITGNGASRLEVLLEDAAEAGGFSLEPARE